MRLCSEILQPRDVIRTVSLICLAACPRLFDPNFESTRVIARGLVAFCETYEDVAPNSGKHFVY